MKIEGLKYVLLASSELGVPSVTQAYDELCARGVTFLKPPGQIRPDAWATNCQDPDGYFVSIYGPQ
jgi:hypothetical protein